MKSKLLQNSKDLLSRSFNPTICKTSLRLAGSRLKLLRNKKEVQLKQMKREIAQLLESGQDQTARIRVEHVIREEKMMAAYDLLEIYCELIVAHLPIIESQKNCPIDLKEAITSLVFASPRCGDVPELLDVRKHFSAKYGKEFITAAIELRPQCGVGRLLVEKLSATAPDGQTKIKILSAIAEEHNVKWDPNSFEDKKLGAPSSIGKESELHAEPTRFETADAQARPSNNVHGSPLNFPQQDPRISLGAEKISSSHTSSVSTNVQPEARPPGDKMSQVFQGDSHNSHPERQKWNMEFKDAASAAQAAAESAERASMAARAAAELSIHGRILTQYPAESQKAGVDISKDGGLEVPPNLNLFEKKSEASVNISSSDQTGLQKAQIDEAKRSNQMTSSRFEEGGCGGTEAYSQSPSLKSKATSEEDSLHHAVPFVDEYTHKNSLKEVTEGQMNMTNETETANSWPEKAVKHGEGKIVKPKSLSSSSSQSSIPDDVNIFASFEDQKFETGIGEDPFVSIGETSFHGEAPQTSSHESASVFFDKSDSEGDDDHVHDKGPTYDEHDLEYHVPSLVQKSPERLPIITDFSSPRSSLSNIVTSASPPLFFSRSENITLRDDSSEPDSFAPVTFDDSDGPTSEIDEDINTSKVEASRNLLHEHYERGQSALSDSEDKTGLLVGSPFKNEEYSESESDSKQLSLSSDDEGMHWKRGQGSIFDADSSVKFSPAEPSAGHSASGSKDSQIELDDNGNKSSPESVERLNFGKLTGGFRHKGHNHHLPFFKNTLGASSSSSSSSSVKKEAETSGTITSPLSEHKKSSTPPDSDSSEEEEVLLKKSSGKQSVNALKTKSTLGASSSIFYSDDSDLDEDYSPKEPLTRKSHLRGGISRRTKATSSNTWKNTRHESPDSDGMDRKPPTSSNSGTPTKSRAQRRNSGKWETHEHPISGKTTNKTMQESKISHKSSAVEEPSSPQQTSDTSVGSENPKAATLNTASSGKDDDTKKASHVHPKLPDYDALVQSLRMNRS